MLFSSFGINLFAQSLKTPLKDTLRLTRISVEDKKGNFVNYYDYIQIKGVYYEINQNFPIDYFECFYSELDALNKFADEINVRRENRFFKYFNNGHSKVVDSYILAKDSAILNCILSKYNIDKQYSDYRIYYK